MILSRPSNSFSSLWITLAHLVIKGRVASKRFAICDFCVCFCCVTGFSLNVSGSGGGDGGVGSAKLYSDDPVELLMIVCLLWGV